MRRLLTRDVQILLVASSVFASAAHAEAGRGDYRQERGDTLRAAHAPRLASMGNDVIRFSSTPALGGRAWIVELHRSKSGRVEGEVQFFDGHYATRWAKTGWMKLRISDADYADLAGRIDMLLARGEPTQRGRDNEIMVCTDGPGYLTERRRAGATEWLSGFCGGFDGEHPNNEIALLFSKVIARNLPFLRISPVGDDVGH